MSSHIVYDNMGRVHFETQMDLHSTTTYGYDGDNHVVRTIETFGMITSSTLTSSAAYDACGWLTSETNTLGKVTTIAYYGLSAGVWTTTATYNSTSGTQNQSTYITQTYLDGYDEQISGTLTDTVTFDEGVDPSMGYWDRIVHNSTIRL